MAGAAAALCEVSRALAGQDVLSAFHVAWCVLLILSASVILGLVAAFAARAFAPLICVPWLAGAGGLLHGWPAALAFAGSGLALGWLAVRTRPASLPWAAGIGVSFEVSSSFANRLTRLADVAGLTQAEIACVQHVAIFTTAGLFLTWLLGRTRIRVAVLPSTLVVLAFAAVFSARDLLAGRARPAFAPAGEGARQPAADEGPSVLLIVLDTVRADHTSLHGYARKTTPRLEELLATQPGAQRFDQAYANGSWTVPAHASLLSGQLPSVHGADFTGRKVGESLRVGIAPEVPMLAELLAERGWTNFAVCANRWLRSAPGFRRGFGRFERVEPRAELEPLGEPLRKLLLPGLRAGLVSSFPTAEQVSERVLARLEEIGSARFFGLVNFMDAHGPHAPLPGVAGSFGPWSVFDRSPEILLANDARTNARLMDRYDEQILYLDRELGRLIDELKRRGILQRTWVFVIGDHGEAFGEHGVTDHGTGLFDEIVRVPLLVLAPRGEQLAANSGPVSQVDVAATIAAISGVEYDGPGRDLRATHATGLVRIQHGAAPYRMARFGAIAGQDARAVVRGKWKLLDIGGSITLFDLENDPGEARDLSAQHPDLVSELRALLPERMLHSTPVAHEQAPTPSEERDLRALGY